jgi:hypothetical protein
LVFGFKRERERVEVGFWGRLYNEFHKLYFSSNIIRVGLEVFTTVVMKNSLFWNITLLLRK